MQTGNRQPQTRISGQTIIDELIRNMEFGRLEMGYGILLPCIFSIYLHPDDYARLAGVQEIIREDARRALSARMAEWNAKPRFRRGGNIDVLVVGESIKLPRKCVLADRLKRRRGCIHEQLQGRQTLLAIDDAARL